MVFVSVAMLTPDPRLLERNEKKNYQNLKFEVLLLREERGIITTNRVLRSRCLEAPLILHKSEFCQFGRPILVSKRYAETAR